MFQDSFLNELIIDNFAGGRPVATALIRANCPEMAYKKAITTVAQLEKIMCRV